MVVSGSDGGGIIENEISGSDMSDSDSDSDMSDSEICEGGMSDSEIRDGGLSNSERSGNGGISDSERVYLALRRDIVEGRYAPGQRIVEQTLATEAEVSRTPVREAVRRLETEGLVVTVRNRGAHVRPLTESDVADLYEARSRIEGFVAELAARRAVPADVASLNLAADQFDAAVAAKSTSRVARLRTVMAANSAFHDGLVNAGQAEQVQRLLAGAVDLPLVFRAFDLFEGDELVRSSLFHHLIAEAVEAAEPERAGRLMTEHVLQGRDAVLAQLRQSGRSNPDTQRRYAS